MNRTVHGFATWAFKFLKTQDGHPPVYSVVCADPSCVDSSAGHLSMEKPQEWALKHAAKVDPIGRHHMVFRVVLETYAVARPVPPGH